MLLTSVVSDGFHVAAYGATASKYRLYSVYPDKRFYDLLIFSGKLSLAQSFGSRQELYFRKIRNSQTLGGQTLVELSYIAGLDNTSTSGQGSSSTERGVGEGGGEKAR